MIMCPNANPITSCLFFFNDTATTEIYTLSLHDALPISRSRHSRPETFSRSSACRGRLKAQPKEVHPDARSEEHTSELQSQSNLVCRLLLEKKKILSLSHIIPNTFPTTLFYPLLIPQSNV